MNGSIEPVPDRSDDPGASYKELSNMSTQTEKLNKRKNELLDQQTLVLNQAQELKRKLTDIEEAAFTAASAEITDIETSVARFEAIAKSKSLISLPTSLPVVAAEKSRKSIDRKSVV